MQIGGAALGVRNLELAESAFREAVALDPQMVDGWVMIARSEPWPAMRPGPDRRWPTGWRSIPASRIWRRCSGRSGHSG